MLQSQVRDGSCIIGLWLQPATNEAISFLETIFSIIIPLHLIRLKEMPMSISEPAGVCWSFIFQNQKSNQKSMFFHWKIAVNKSAAIAIC